MRKKMPKRYPHPLSNRHDFTMDMGFIIPFNWYEILPGDTFQASTTAAVKCNQLLAQIQTPCQVTITHAYIPSRLTWEDSEEFHTGGEDGMSVFDHPSFQPGVVAESSLLNYLGFAPGDYGTREFNAQPIRAYSLYVNHFHKDQDLMTDRVIDKTSGLDTTTETDLAPAMWSKDYFQAARPFTQRGDELIIPVSNAANELEVGIDGPITATPTPIQITNFNDDTKKRMHIPSGGGYLNDNNNAVTEDSSHVMKVQLASNLGLSVDDFRVTIALQRMYERMGNNGFRYSDYLNSLGLPSSDARLNQPELLGIGKNIITFSEVLSTDGANTGEEYGHGLSVMRTNRFRRYFEEHGIMMSFIVVMPKPQYAQCLDRYWLKTTKEDFYIPEIQNTGEMVITNAEAYSLHSQPDHAWGFLPRNEDYRGKHSRISGELHSTQNHRHMSRIYSGDVALNDTWLTTQPTKRVFGAPGTESLNVTCLNNTNARRLVQPMGRSKII